MSSRATIVGAFRHVADGRTALTITDVQGRRVLRQALALNRGRVRWEWNRRSADGNRVAPGVYVVELRYGDEVLRSRVVVRN
jgi:flagellar hook assembly protein FlgD